METNTPDTDLALERLNRAARQRHQQLLMDAVGRRTDRWADRVRRRRRYGAAAVVLVLLFVATPTVMAQHLPDTPVRAGSLAQQQHSYLLAHDIISSL